MDLASAPYFLTATASTTFSFRERTVALEKQRNIDECRGSPPFGATWCHGCKTEIPWYMEYQNKYKAKGLSVIGVAMDDKGWQIVKPFIKNLKINYPVVVGNWDLAKGFGIKALPVTLLVDRDGKVADFHDQGLVDRKTFEKEIQTLLRVKSR
jgi:thiol-disulfide isomerase/thioredoxin